MDVDFALRHIGNEYRRLFAEVWGTFLLVLVAAGGGVIGAGFVPVWMSRESLLPQPR